MLRFVFATLSVLVLLAPAVAQAPSTPVTVPPPAPQIGPAAIHRLPARTLAASQP